MCVRAGLILCTRLVFSQFAQINESHSNFPFNSTVWQERFWAYAEFTQGHSRFFAPGRFLITSGERKVLSSNLSLGKEMKVKLKLLCAQKLIEKILIKQITV